MIRNLVTLHRSGQVYQWSTDLVRLEPNLVTFNIDGVETGFEIKDTDDWTVEAVETVETITDWSEDDTREPYDIGWDPRA